MYILQNDWLEIVAHSCKRCMSAVSGDGNYIFWVNLPLELLNLNFGFFFGWLVLYKNGTLILLVFVYLGLLSICAHLSLFVKEC